MARNDFGQRYGKVRGILERLVLLMKNWDNKCSVSGPNMEYAQMMMSCGLLVCPADETDIQRAEETNTLISLSDKHSKNCPHAQKNNQIHGRIEQLFEFTPWIFTL